MKKARSAGIVRGRSRRRGTGLFAVVGAALLLVSPVAAQSPSPSLAPEISAAPASPVPEASADPTLAGLADLEAAFAAQACDPLLTADEVAVAAGGPAIQGVGGRGVPEVGRPGFIQLDCSWSVEGGRVWLTVDERAAKGKGKPKAKDLLSTRQFATTPDATRIEGLGTVGYSDPGSDGGLFPDRPSVTWALWVKHGKAFADRRLSLLSDVLDVASLEQLARGVLSDADPGDPPGPVALAPEAAALVGAWTLSGWEGPPFPFQASPIVTVALDAAGTVTSTFDCERAGAKPRIATGLVFVAGDRITTLADGKASSGACSAVDGEPFDIEPRAMLMAAPEAISSANDATWSIDGDTLTITGSSFFSTLTFDRAS